MDRYIFIILLLNKLYRMITALLIIYGLGLIFTWSIDLTVVNPSIRFKGWKHLLTMFLIWICSPLLILSVIYLTIKYFVTRRKYRKG